MKNHFLDAVKDRRYLGAVVMTALALIAIFILSALFIRPNDLQVPLRYSSFGIAHILREKWFNEFLFPVFAILVAVVNTILGVKLYLMKGKSMAIAWQWLTVGLLLIAFMIFLAAFRLVSVLQ